MLGGFAKDVARPVFVNLITAATLFSAAVVFKGPILSLFGLNKADGYPIVCSAGFYRPADAPDKVRMDFYFTNPSPDSFDDRLALLDRLDAGAQDKALTYTPDIELTLSAPFKFRFDRMMEREMERFNGSNGTIAVRLSEDRQVAVLSLEAIKLFTTVKATFEVEGLEVVALLGGRTHGSVVSLPAGNFDATMSRCYTVS